MSVRGSYPRLYSAIKEMARTEAIKTPMARAIARKAGLRSGASEEGEFGVITLIDATLGPHHLPLYSQWSLDLSPYTRLRLEVRHQEGAIVKYTLAGGNALDPAGWLPVEGFFPDYGTTEILGSSDANGLVGDLLYWMVIPEELKAPVRLCFVNHDGIGASPVDTWTYYGGPWGVLLQAE